MAFSFDDFNPDENPEQGGFDPIPGGSYPVIVTEAFMKGFDDGKGEAYRLKLQILNGQFQNRILFVFMGVAHADEHTNEKKAMMVKIAKGMVTGLGKALGVPKVPNPSFPIGRQMVVKVSCKKSKKTGELENQVDRFLPLDAGHNQPPPQGAAPPAMQGHQGQPPMSNPGQTVAPQVGYQQPSLTITQGQPAQGFPQQQPSPFGQQGGNNDVPF